MRKRITFLIIGLVILIGVIIFSLRLTKEITYAPEKILKPEIQPLKLERPMPSIIAEEVTKVEPPLPPEELIPEIDSETLSAIEKRIQEEKEEEKAEPPLRTQPHPEELKELKQKGAIIY